ncbi:MAG: ABC transporter substrate-binding protein [Clostridiales bacterium]|nr:ABC transporter substrate-binding protein [Clostridiales bacterium]
MKKILAILLALTLIVCAFAACGKQPTDDGATTPAGTSDTTETNDKPLVVGYSNFSSKFSPFFAETAYDQDVASMTAAALLTTDRVGAVVEKGKTGETRSYNGTDYTYYGPADLVITTNDDGTVDYDFTLRDDITFSDGEKLTVDDVIFSMYVLSDPTYDGSSTFFALPIKGMEEYRSGMDTLFNIITAAGRENTDFTNWTEEQQTALWADIDQAGEKFAQDIVDYCIANGYNAETDSVAVCAANWGFEIAEDATAADFFKAIEEAYTGEDGVVDYATLSGTETANTSLFDFMEKYEEYRNGVKTGDSAENIEGIQKTGENTLRVSLTEIDATAIYQLGVTIAPMHYYGDASLYDYDNNKFGFEKGNLTTVRAKTTEPMGAGPYKFIKYENGTVSFEAYEGYYLGGPKTKNVQFLESSDEDKLNGLITGRVDITDPSYSQDTVKAIKEANGNDNVVGDKITTNTVNNLGYGYLGISAKAVNVGGEIDSDASKNLRKAFATVFSVYRDLTVDSYYGETASVINYPISDTSWAAPQKTDEGYSIAFSKDVEGNDIYTSDMDQDAKTAAALKAALGFFEAAGYTVEDGKVTAAPEGAALDYEVWIPADGAGDHPSFMMLNLASDALATIGVTLNVKDLANSADLWTGIEADKVPMWCAAWGATPDPDMYQVYYSGVESGKDPGGSNYMYDIADAELDQLILDARSSMDQAYRKQMYKACLDIIVDWAVEIPVYQRQNAIIFSTERVNIDTVTPDITTYYGWMAEIQNLEMK